MSLGVCMAQWACRAEVIHICESVPSTLSSLVLLPMCVTLFTQDWLAPGVPGDHICWLYHSSLHRRARITVILFCFILRDRDSLRRPGWPQVLRDPLPSVSSVLGLKARPTTAWSDGSFIVCFMELELRFSRYDLVSELFC